MDGQNQDEAIRLDMEILVSAADPPEEARLLNSAGSLRVALRAPDLVRVFERVAGHTVGAHVTRTAENVVSYDQAPRDVVFVHQSDGYASVELNADSNTVRGFIDIALGLTPEGGHSIPGR